MKIINNGYIALGYLDDLNVIYSIYRNKEVKLSAKSFTKQEMINIFSEDFLLNYTDISKDGDVKLNLQKLQTEIVKNCLEAGFYNEENVYGNGIFTHPLDSKKLIINTEKIFSTRDYFDSKVRFVENNLFIANKNLKIEKGSREITLDNLNVLKDFIGNYNFKTKNADKLIMGWIALAPLAGALKWRPHIYITASAGSGKSHLLRFMNNIIGELSIYADAKSTEAGIRQAVGKGSYAVLLDESESEQAKINSILSMLRSASASSQQLMGTQNQSGMSFSLKMMGAMVGISPPIMNEADKSRFIMIEMNKFKNLRVDENGKLDKKDLVNQLNQDEILQKELGRNLLMTTINNYELLLNIINDVNEVFREKEIRDRLADTFGQVIAASFMYYKLQAENCLDETILFEDYKFEDLVKYCESFDLDSLKDNDDNNNEYDKLFELILKKDIYSERLERNNVIFHIANYFDNFNKKEIKNLLGNFGMKIGEDEKGRFLIIDTEDKKLKDNFFKNTEFENSAIKAILSRSEKSENIDKKVEIGNITRYKTTLIKFYIDEAKYNIKNEVEIEEINDEEINDEFLKEMNN